jgi:hypothetical protein
MTVIDLCRYDTDPEHAVSGDGGAIQSLWERDDRIAQDMHANGIESNAEQFGQPRDNEAKVAICSGSLAVAS